MHLRAAATLFVLALAVPMAAQAHPRLVYVGATYQPPPPAPYTLLGRPLVPVQLQRRFSIGLRLSTSAINQTVAGEDVVMGGGGVTFGYRHSRHWGLEFAVERMDGSFADGRFRRSSVPVTLSLMCHLTPRGAFDLYLLGGIGYVGSDVRVENPPGHPELAVGEQSFNEFQAHLGVGAELRLGRLFGILADLRYIGRVLDESSLDGRWYEGVDGGVIPSTSQGAQFTLGAALHF